MKKAIIFSFILIFSMVSLFAVMTSAGSTYNGFSGIPIGSIYYQGGPWVRGGETLVDKSSDNEMIALISFWNIDNNSKNKPFTISVSCPNGMYMTSISNPTFKRPFEIEFNAKSSESKKYSGFKLSNDNPVYQFVMGNDNTYSRIWFDVVVCLPVKNNGGNSYAMDYESDRLTVVENGRDVIYPLIEADDYTALVTIKIEHDDLATPIELVIPFSGYYKHDTTAANHLNRSSYKVALDIQTYPEAKNLDLGVNNRGKWISVGYISFLINGKDSGNKKADNAAIFLSSSPVATVKGDRFTLKKDDLTYSDTLTTTNSIKFDVQVVGDNGTISTFDGTDYFETSNIYVSQLPSNFIKLNGDVGQNEVKFNDGEHNSSKYYRSYNGTMQVKIEQSDVTLAAGKYEGDIYVHVLVEK